MSEKSRPKVLKPTVKPGGRPAVLKLGGDWQAAMRKSLKKRKPAGGWPKQLRAAEGCHESVPPCAKYILPIKKGGPSAPTADYSNPTRY
jgi:hypothetical protein